VLAITLGGGWFVGVYLAGSPPSVRAVGTSNGIDMLTAVGGVLAGALATFVGARIADHRLPPPPPPTEPTEPTEETND
jgi:energy-converting hydrogenase Eha subunit B